MTNINTSTDPMPARGPGGVPLELWTVLPIPNPTPPSGRVAGGNGQYRVKHEARAANTQYPRGSRGTRVTFPPLPPRG